MNPDESSSPGGLPDSDLDQLLAATNKDLLARIEAAADPTSILTAIIVHTVPPGIGDSNAAVAASGRGVHRIPAVLAIGIRSSVRRLDRVLTNARARVLATAHMLDLALDIDIIRDLDLDLDLILDVVHDLALIRDIDFIHDLALIRDLDLDLDRTRALILDLDLDLDRRCDLDRHLHHARDLVDFIIPALARARGRVLDLDRVLRTQQVDASGADLSEIAIEDLDALDGVIWTNQTTWPPGIADQVHAYSRKIRPGVYQVGQGNDRGRIALASG